ncbi:MAG: hypothetical protein HQ500_06940 [Flavobacteriales bacterium]|nr:hypothetical protein [Flavobacteriales bacterium]
MKWFVTIVFALVLGTGYAQSESNNLLLGGAIRDAQGGQVKHASIRVTNAEGDFYTVMANNDGTFEFTVPFDMVCDVRFYAKKHQPKSIVLDTRNVPANEQEWGHEFSGFSVDLVQEKQPQLPKVVGRIFYDVVSEGFITQEL